jgi:hypothetical protein
MTVASVGPVFDMLASTRLHSLDYWGVIVPEVANVRRAERQHNGDIFYGNRHLYYIFFTNATVSCKHSPATALYVSGSSAHALKKE